MITIISENSSEITLLIEEEKCPYCKNENIKKHLTPKDYLFKSGVKEFFKKKIIIKRVRYICSCCRKTFAPSVNFTDKIFSKDLKPIIKFAFENDFLKTKKISKELLEELNLNNHFRILSESEKILTLIDTINFEIIEFEKNYKKIKEIQKFQNEERVIIRKNIKYKPFKRKAKHKFKGVNELLF